MNNCRSCGVAITDETLLCDACKQSVPPEIPAYEFTIANPVFWSLTFAALAVGSLGWYSIFANPASTAKVVSVVALGVVLSVAALIGASRLLAPHRVISQCAFIVNLSLAALTLCLVLLMGAFPT